MSFAGFVDALQKRASKLTHLNISSHTIGNLKPVLAQMNKLQELILPWADLMQCPTGSLWYKNFTLLEVHNVSGNWHWLTGMDNLQTLSLEKSGADVSRLDVLELLPKLRHLKLAGFEGSTMDVHLDLESLTLQETSSFDLSASFSPNLRRLSLYQPVHISLVDAFWHLKELRLESHSRHAPSYRFLASVAKNCPELEVIEIPWYKGVANLKKGLAEVIGNCEKLKTIRANSGTAKELLQLDQMLPTHIDLLHV